MLDLTNRKQYSFLHVHCQRTIRRATWIVNPYFMSPDEFIAELYIELCNDKTYYGDYDLASKLSTLINKHWKEYIKWYRPLLQEEADETNRKVQARWVKRHPKLHAERQKACASKRRDTLTDGYIRNTLKQSIPLNQITPLMIEQKRQEIIMKRDLGITAKQKLPADMLEEAHRIAYHLAASPRIS